jgi:hypothetical protein
MDAKTFLKLFVLSVLACPLGFAQDKLYCLEGLAPTKPGELDYSERPGRCEGFYIQKVSSTDITLVSMTGEAVEDFLPINSLAITWRGPSNAATDLRLQAQGIKSRLFYRMDTENPVMQGEFAWDTEILNGASIKPKDIGLLGWAEFPQGDVYVPVQLFDGSSGMPKPVPSPVTYTLVFTPNSELDEVYLAYGFAGADASDLEKFDIESLATQPLEYGYYPAGVPFDYPIPVATLTETGFYVLRLQAVADGGSPITEEWFFFHEN